jgi:chemotaxis protein methyltransferase CheR
MNDEIEAIEIRLLLEAIHARYGYDLREYAASSMRRRVLAGLASSGAAHFGELQHRLLHDAEFFARFLDTLTVRVTDLFRDPPFHRAFRAHVVPFLRTYPFVKIWHAGCSTGEEVYASAILMTEEGLYERTQFYATDLSTEALRTAKEGVYSADGIGRFTESYAASGGTSALARYYTSAYGRIAMAESLRKNVVFFPHDLVGDHAFGEMQVIVCRNVLMYFEPALRERVVDKFAESLCHGGFLCLGSSEHLRPKAETAFTVVSAEERIYRRAG